MDVSCFKTDDLYTQQIKQPTEITKMSSDEEYLFDETEDRDSGNESPDNTDDEDEGDWGMDIGLGKSMIQLFVIRNKKP